MLRSVKESPSRKWRISWASGVFRRKLILGLTLVSVILAAFPFFFQFIENRRGHLMDDWVLDHLPVQNVSVPIFVFIWATTLLFLIRCMRDPEILMRFVWSYVLLCLFRMLTIWLISLEPPAGLLPLADPITNSFYGGSYVTHDLFFSGHTATVFLLALCLKGKYDRIAAMGATAIVGTLLLVQHVHYTVDVVLAPLLTWLVYLAGKKIAGNPAEEKTFLPGEQKDPASIPGGGS